MIETLTPPNKVNVPKEKTSDKKSFWKQGIFDTFLGVNNKTVHYAIFPQTEVNQQKKSLIIVPGRAESYLKYQELIYDFHLKGYCIFIIDHRGQGLSERLIENPHQGYVAKFQDYVDDFNYFVKYIVREYRDIQPYILAHSMGGTIATRFMQDYPNAIKAAVLASPMLGLEAPILPKKVVEKIINVKLLINNLFNNAPCYFFGQKDYSPIPFSENRLTHSRERYQCFVDLYQKHKNVQLGGVTTHWLKEALSVEKVIFNRLTQLTSPILLLQAGCEKIVSSDAQDSFCHKLNKLQSSSCPNGRAVTIEGANHELFFETDEIRNQAIQESLSWFDKH